LPVREAGGFRHLIPQSPKPHQGFFVWVGSSLPPSVVKTIGQEAWTIPWNYRVGFFQPFIAVSIQLGTIVKNSRAQPQIIPTHMPETPSLPLPPLPKTPPSPFLPQGIGLARSGVELFGFLEDSIGRAAIPTFVSAVPLPP
jgi:hypothetical protein